MMFRRAEHLLLVVCVVVCVFFSSSIPCVNAISVHNLAHIGYNDMQRRRKRDSAFVSSVPLHDATGVAEKDYLIRGGASSSSTTTTDETAWMDGLKASVASALAAAFSKIILAPFDTIKTLQQYHQATQVEGSLSLMEASKMIVARPGGFLNFYAGLTVSVLGAMPSVALYFGTYSYFKTAFTKGRTDKDGNTYYIMPRTLGIALSAALGNSIASGFRVPYEVLKQKLQTNAYRNTWEALMDIKSLQDIFPRGGIAIQMMRDIPYAVVTLLLYESLQSALVRYYERQDNRRRHQASWDLVVGGAAGGMGSWVTNPLDVIKTRLQTAPPEVYDGSVWKCAVDTFDEGGAMAFLRGSWPRLMHKVPANAMFFLFYEFFKRLLGFRGKSY